MEPSDFIPFRSEPGFIDAVVAEMGGFRVLVATDLKSAIHANALDPKRDDQWTWMKRAAQMIGAKFLPDEDPD